MRTTLDTLAFCCASQRKAVSSAAGVEPLTSPPMVLERFDPGLLQDRDLLYFSLHGLPEQPYWYGDDWITAMSVDAFTNLDLAQTVVFIANCHLTESPFLDVLLAKKPRLLVGGAGLNYTRPQTLVGAHLLGYYIRLCLQIGFSPRRALTIARGSVRLQNTAIKKQPFSHRRKEDLAANQDALDFIAYLHGEPYA